ncbi:MAG: DUF1311 domain-containing protein, partial [Candidatus Gastranaerophilales bacterium]|nr:DUF1311 domain-containing protein [Candidatus Gastranaerophilales bacterium]
KAFLEGIYEKLKKDLTPEEIKKLDESQKKWNHWWAGRRYRKACCKAYIKQERNAIEAFFTELISTDPGKIKVVNGLVTIEGSGLKPRRIPNVTNKKELDAYLEKINLYKKKFSEFMEELFGFEFYDKKSPLAGQMKPNITKEKLYDVKAMEFLAEIGLIKKQDLPEADLITECAEIRQRTVTIPNIAKKLREKGLDNLAEVLETWITEQSKESSRNMEMIVGGEYIRKNTLTLGQLFNRLGIKNGKLEELMGKTVKEVLEILLGKDKLKDLGTKVHDVDKMDPEQRYKKLFDGKLLVNFAENIIKNNINKLDTTRPTFIKYSGMVINLFTTVITCTVLNLAYPRVVAKFWPDLLSEDEKKQAEARKGGNKSC